LAVEPSRDCAGHIGRHVKERPARRLVSDFVPDRRGGTFRASRQILLYAGGIMVLVLFVIMLSGNPKDWIARQVNEQWLGGLLVSAVFVSLLATLFRLMPEAQAVAPAEPTTASLGILLLRDMVLPFEAISLVLLSALVGAILFSRRSER
jgi:NADH:ubiquinone oxidoreductase subunit 6 (subunit J)